MALKITKRVPGRGFFRSLKNRDMLIRWQKRVTFKRLPFLIETLNESWFKSLSIIIRIGSSLTKFGIGLIDLSS